MWCEKKTPKSLKSFFSEIPTKNLFQPTWLTSFAAIFRLSSNPTVVCNYVIIRNNVKNGWLPWRNWLGSINNISFKFVAIFSAFIFPIALAINHILNPIKFFFVFHYFFDSLLFQKFFVSETKYKAEFHGLGRDGSGLCGPLNLLGCKINFSLNIEQMNFRFSRFSSGQCFAPLV